MIFGIMLLIGLASTAICLFVALSSFFTAPLLTISMTVVFIALCYWRHRHNVRKFAPIHAENMRREAAFMEERRLRREKMDRIRAYIRSATPEQQETIRRTMSSSPSSYRPEPPYSPEPWDLNPPKPQPEINEWLW